MNLLGKKHQWIADRLDELRLTRTWLAAACGVSYQTVWKWIKGQHTPDFYHRRAIARALELDEAVVHARFLALETTVVTDQSHSHSPQNTLQIGDDVDRREFIRTTVLTGVYSSIGDPVSELIGSGERFDDDNSFRRGFIQERILGLNGTTFLNPGDLRKRLGLDGVNARPSHEQAVLRAIRTIDEKTIMHEALESILPHDSIVASGAPVSNDISAAYLPVAALGEDFGLVQRAVVPRDALPYHFGTGSDHSIRVVSGTHGGKVVAKRNNAIVEYHENMRIRRPSAHIDREGKLARDYLLLTRLPRTTSGGELLIIAGLHGPSTQAFELLLCPRAFPDEELRWLATQIGHEPYFQAVFEADEMLHRKPMSRAKSLRVSRLLPPKPIHITSSFFA